MSAEAMKQALEALEYANTGNRRPEVLVPAIISLRQAIEQAEKQEPVAWSCWQSCLNDDGTQTAPWVHRLSKFKPTESIINKDITPLYASPPQRQPLTEEELLAVYETEQQGRWGDHVRGLRAVEEAAHGIKGEV